MTPKEKAKQLYNSFLPLVRFSDLYDTYRNKSKESALICIQEICEYKRQLEKEYGEDFYHAYGVENYWEQVRKEIEKL